MEYERRAHRGVLLRGPQTVDGQKHHPLLS